MTEKQLLPVGLEPTASELEVRRAAIAPRELFDFYFIKIFTLHLINSF